jgi:hypothetical protein
MTVALVLILMWTSCFSGTDAVVRRPDAIQLRPARYVVVATYSRNTRPPAHRGRTTSARLDRMVMV